MSETREQYLARVAQVHSEWVDKYAESVPFNPDSYPEGSDYNLWNVDVEAGPEAVSEFMRATAPPPEGFAPEPEESCPAYVFASDVDGVRFLIVDDVDVDCTGWFIEAEYGGYRHKCAFKLDRVYSKGAGTNLIGYGEGRQAWLAVADRDMRAAKLVSPHGRQHPVSDL